FGTLALNHATGPALSHLPFLLSADGMQADMHLARSNPLLGLLDNPAPVVLSISGPDGYVSPDWYGVEDQVPTWAYVAVHLRGRVERRPIEELRAQIEGVSAAFETRLAGKAPWTTDKMRDGVLARMMRAILPVRLTIESIEGTWKLGQNKPDAARLRAADAIEAGSGMELALLSALMRSVGDLGEE
ncbi:MAG TPA: FMN-binding negative transcriptional regulator, partial [Rhodobacterales bacterium]|nr:FMN-binding negative transcriptional regulator [Rhodobacterales bacterium]